MNWNIVSFSYVDINLNLLNNNLRNITNLFGKISSIVRLAEIDLISLDERDRREH